MDFNDLYLKGVYAVPADFLEMRSLTGTVFYHSYNTDRGQQKHRCRTGCAGLVRSGTVTMFLVPRQIRLSAVTQRLAVFPISRFSGCTGRLVVHELLFLETEVCSTKLNELGTTRRAMLKCVVIRCILQPPT